MKQKAAVCRVLGKGAAAGVLSTAVTSIVFVGAARLGLLDRKPPRIIVDHFLPDLRKVPADRLALAAHLTYGAAGGAVLAALASVANRSAACRAGCGMVYGVAVWAASYEGWLPALGVLPPAHRDRTDGAGAIIAAHIVYGVSLGLLVGCGKNTLGSDAKPATGEAV